MKIIWDYNTSNCETIDLETMLIWHHAPSTISNKDILEYIFLSDKKCSEEIIVYIIKIESNDYHLYIKF